jgi:antitoxin HicB
MSKKINNVNPHVGSSFDDFLEEENLLASAQISAIKRVIAYLLQQKIDNHEITKTALAERLGTSRAALDRILDPENTSITLANLAKAADYTGKSFEFRIHG